MSRKAMKHIKTWSERCEEHPDHQQGMVSKSMIQARMQEEIDELRQALETKREWVGLTDGEIDILSCEMVKGYKSVNWLCKVLEAKLKEKNHG